MDINIQVVPGQIIEIGGRRYETTGDFRRPNGGEHWLSTCGEIVFSGSSGHCECRLILRPLSTRKVPTDKDAAVWPRRRCWVRDSEDEKWNESILLAVISGSPCSFRTTHDVRWRYCEIEVEE